MQRYHELKIPGQFAPLELSARLASSGEFTEHVVYERDGQWWFAGGSAAEIVLDSQHVRSRWDDDERIVPWSSDPLHIVRDLLAEVPIVDGNAYGWMCFEFAYALARPELAGNKPLLHVMVPHTEVHLTSDAVIVRSLDWTTVTRIRELIANPVVGALDEPQLIDIDAAGYHDKVAEVVSDIRNGDLQKAILSRKVPLDFPVDFAATYLRGRIANNPARSFLLELGGWTAAGFSPETVCEVSADGHVLTQPLAGTRAAGLGADVDEFHRSQLLADPKEVFEHAASVKLAYDELAPICADDTVRVAEFMAIKQRGSVQHLGSTVIGVLAEDQSPWDAVQALFPAVTASGIPKAPAYDRIHKLEGERGLYAGAVLQISHDGAIDAALVLRAVLSNDGETWLQAGAGIVGESRPEREYEETCEKLRSVSPYVVAKADDRALAAAL